MSIADSIRLLYCLNETGVDKAYELLESLLHSHEFQRITQEQLQQEIVAMKEQIIADEQKAEEEAKQKRRNQQQEIQQQYATEFKMIGSSKASWEQINILEVIIDATDRHGGLFALTRAYNWGYIQGKRAERARRKKVVQ